MQRLGLLIAVSGCSGMLIAIFNKAMTGGVRNAAARTSWALFGAALAFWIYGGVQGMIHALENGVTAIQSRAGSSLFEREEHPLIFWIAFTASTGAMALFAVLSLGCFWKAFRKV